MNENDENQVGGAASDLANTIDRARRLLALASEEMQYAGRLAGVEVPQETLTDTWGRTWTPEALMQELGKRTAENGELRKKVRQLDEETESVINLRNLAKYYELNANAYLAQVDKAAAENRSLRTKEAALKARVEELMVENASLRDRVDAWSKTTAGLRKSSIEYRESMLACKELLATIHGGHFYTEVYGFGQSARDALPKVVKLIELSCSSDVAREREKKEDAEMILTVLEGVIADWREKKLREKPEEKSEEVAETPEVVESPEVAESLIQPPTCWPTGSPNSTTLAQAIIRDAEGKLVSLPDFSQTATEGANQRGI